MRSLKSAVEAACEGGLVRVLESVVKVASEGGLEQVVWNRLLSSDVWRHRNRYSHTMSREVLVRAPVVRVLSCF